MWDDDIAIYLNPAIRSLEPAKIFTDVDSMMRYNPLTLLGWSITYHFFGAKPFWYHFGNWLMHGLSAVLVFLVLRKLLVLVFLNYKKLDIYPWRINIAAGLAALLWSIHPLRVEPVAWCTDRTYCQALLFLLLALLFYLWANEADKSISRHYILLTVSVILYIVSLLSHAVGITFFLVLFVIDIYLLRKLGDSRGWWKSTAGRRALLEKIPFAIAALAIAVITVCIRIASAGVWQKPVSLADFGLIERFMQAMYIWAYYIWRPWYPVDLAPVYPTLVSFNPFSPAFIASAVFVIGIITSMIFLRRRWPLGQALGMCHFLLLVPVLGLFEHPHYPCDRYSLIVSILWSILLAIWLANTKTKILRYGISLVLSIIVITILGLLTFRQTSVWTNSETFFKHIIKTLDDAPYRSKIYWRLGTVYRLQGNMDEAAENLSKAVEFNPYHLAAQNELAATLQVLGRSDEAIKNLDRLVQLRPVEGNYLLAIALARSGKTNQAITHLKETLRLAPNWVDPINKLAWILATNKDIKLRDPKEAIKLATRGCELTKYQEADLLDTLAAAYASAGKFTEALYYAEKALKLTKLSPKQNQIERIQNHYRLYQQGLSCIEQ